MNKFTLGWAAALIAAASLAACGDDVGGSGAGGAGPGAGGATASGSGGDATTATVTGSAASSTTTAVGTGGGGTGGGGGAATCDSGLEQASPACQACQDASCCITASLAAADPGTWTGSAAKICREANCFEECGVEEPECGGIVPSPASCADELYANCCAETEACAKDDACVALIYVCVDDRGCDPGSECFDTCTADLGLEGGLPAWNAFLECFLGPWSCQ